MPRGRHRHSPPLHRLLPPSAIAGVSLVCALGPWVFTAPAVLRPLAAAAALTAVTGAIVMRRWDAQAGRKVADLTRARASDEWRFEERVAELESDLEESRELRVRLERKLRAKRTELAGLRNEHAALLRRYATAETERASALEGRRLLELEAGPGARALPAAAADREAASTAPEPEGTEAKDTEAVGAEATEAVKTAEEKPAAVTPAVFSPEGSALFLRAMTALARLDAAAEPAKEAPADTAADAGAGPAREDEPQGQPEAADAHEHAAATPTTETGERRPGVTAESGEADESARPATTPASPQSAETATTARTTTTDETTTATPEAVQAPAAPASAVVPASGRPAQQPAGHFTVPIAVAVVPATPARRPVVEGGFDFFGAKKGAPTTALEAVQNEDLADVVGQEALALHKAESESQYKQAGPDAHGVGQVIDLTAHDETEQIDVQGLRTAAS